jgi:Flp pilus assembly protein TadD
VTVSTTDGASSRAASALSQEVVVPLATGMAFWCADDPLMAATQLDRALQSPDLDETTRQQLLNDYGAALLGVGRSDLAEPVFRAAQEIHENATTWVGMGALATLQREWEAAERASVRAVDIDPHNAAGYCGLSVVAAMNLQGERAVRAAQQAVGIDSGQSVPHAILGLAKERRGDIAGAIKSYQTAATLSAGNSGLYNAVTDRAKEIQLNPPTPVPTATLMPTPSPTPIPTIAIHKVQRGENLALIAAMYEGVTVEMIVQTNELSDRDSIDIDQELLIPAPLD